MSSDVVGRYCGGIFNQIHSVQQTLKPAERVITRNHPEMCVTDATRSGNEKTALESYDETRGILEQKL